MKLMQAIQRSMQFCPQTVIYQLDKSFLSSLAVLLKYLKKSSCCIHTLKTKTFVTESFIKRNLSAPEG